jgi:hypothetical protein
LLEPLEAVFIDNGIRSCMRHGCGSRISVKGGSTDLHAIFDKGLHVRTVRPVNKIRVKYPIF